MIVHQAISTVPCQNTLGEACVWNGVDETLWWTDIEARRVYRLDASGGPRHFDLPDRPAFVFPRLAGGFVVGFPGMIAIADAAFERFECITEIEADITQTRLNDAVVDPSGGIIVGTYNQQDRRPIGAVYRISPSREVHKLIDTVAAANGLAFSLDGDILYFADSAQGTIRRFAVTPSIAISEIPPLAPPDIAPGAPDGAAVDQDGGYWSTRLRAGCVVRIDENGKVTDRIELPAMAPTCAAFGGNDLRTLFITSRRFRQPADEIQRLPQSGDLFSVDVGFAGSPPTMCRL